MNSAVVVVILHAWMCSEPGPAPGRAWGDCYPQSLREFATMAECRAEARAVQAGNLRAHAWCRKEERR